MFSSKAQLSRRTPQNGTDRENFLSLLVDEYLHSSALEAKCQVLANLANFAYDPINYSYIRDVGVLDIFLHVVKTENNHKLVQFAAAGVCNLCIDSLNAEYIITHAGVKPLIALLKSKDTNTVASIITTLIYLHNDHTKSQINTPEVTDIITELQKGGDNMITNLSTIFLQDVCGVN